MNKILLLNAAVIQVNLLIAIGFVPIVAALNVYDKFDLKLVELVAVINK